MRKLRLREGVVGGTSLTGGVSSGTVGGDMVMSEIVVPKGDFTFEQFRALNPTFTKFRLRRFFGEECRGFYHRNWTFEKRGEAISRLPAGSIVASRREVMRMLIQPLCGWLISGVPAGEEGRNRRGVAEKGDMLKAWTPCAFVSVAAKWRES